MSWFEPDASAKRCRNADATSLICPNGNVYHVPGYKSCTSRRAAACRVADGVRIVYGTLGACERGCRVTEVLARCRPDYISPSVEYPCDHGSVCLRRPGWKSVASEELWDICHRDAVLQTDGFVPERRLRFGFVSLDEKAMCPGMAESLFFYNRPAHTLARETLCVRNWLVIWKVADALSAVVDCGKKALIVVRLLRANSQAKWLKEGFDVAFLDRIAAIFLVVSI